MKFPIPKNTYIIRKLFHVRLQPFTTTSRKLKMELKEVITKLNEYAPLSLAAKWDNVGLLLEPTLPHTVGRILLTNDLTEDVLEEACQKKVNLILSYHPPLFASLKRITQKTWKERLVAKCFENRIAIYSPHTAYDCLRFGVNDWLASAFDNREVCPITPSPENELFSGLNNHEVEISLFNQDGDPNDKPVLFKTVLQLEQKLSRSIRETSDNKITFSCQKRELISISEILRSEGIAQSPKYEIKVRNLHPLPLSDYGLGRICTLISPLTLKDAMERIKTHLQLKSVRIAVGKGSNLDSVIRHVALCAGSGSSVLKGVNADLYWTGEMSHHDVLDAVHDGTSVVLCEHSNTERGFLKAVLAKTLKELLNDNVEIFVAENDRDPLEIY